VHTRIPFGRLAYGQHWHHAVSRRSSCRWPDLDGLAAGWPPPPHRSGRGLPRPWRPGSAAWDLFSDRKTKTKTDGCGRGTGTVAVRRRPTGRSPMCRLPLRRLARGCVLAMLPCLSVGAAHADTWDAPGDSRRTRRCWASILWTTTPRCWRSRVRWDCPSRRGGLARHGVVVDPAHDHLDSAMIWVDRARAFVHPRPAAVVARRPGPK